MMCIFKKKEMEGDGELGGIGERNGRGRERNGGRCAGHMMG